MQENLKTQGSSPLRSVAHALLGSGIFCTVVLLLSNLRPGPARIHSYVSSAPLALAGLGYALLQISLRPASATMLKRLLLAATFIGWAVDQLLPAGPLAVFIGDLVIAAYVLDLYWIARDQIRVQA